MATTPNAALPLLDGNSVVNPIQTPFNALADAIDAAFGGIGAGESRIFKGTTAGRSSVTGMVEGDMYRETDGAKLLWVFRGGGWFIVAGQVLASMVAPTTNVVTAGALVGSVISTPPLTVGQRVKIFGTGSPYNQTAAGPSELQLNWRNNAGDVAAGVYNGFQIIRAYSATASTVAGTGAFATLATATVAAKISAGIFVGPSPSAAYGADGTHLWIESA